MSHRETMNKIRQLENKIDIGESEIEKNVKAIKDVINHVKRIESIINRFQQYLTMFFITSAMGGAPAVVKPQFLRDQRMEYIRGIARPFEGPPGRRDAWAEYTRSFLHPFEGPPSPVTPPVTRAPPKVPKISALSKFIRFTPIIGMIIPIVITIATGIAEAITRREMRILVQQLEATRRREAEEVLAAAEEAVRLHYRCVRA